MSISKTHMALVAAGALLGAVGAQVAKSGIARSLAVRGVVAGMMIKDEYEGIVEQAKAEVDDIVAEAAYLHGVCESAPEDADPISAE